MRADRRARCAAARIAARSSRPRCPRDLGRDAPTGTGSTQQAFGRFCSTSPARPRTAAERVVTVSPDVSSSTNLGGWINKVGRVVAERARATGSPTTPRRSCTGASSRPASTSSSGIAEINLVGAARRARRHLEPVGPAAAADRHDLRPVRRPRAGAVVVRHLRRRPVDPGRHAVRGHARARGRRAPVDHHAVDRHRAARLRRWEPAFGRTSSGRCSPRSASSAARTAARPTSGCPPGPSTRPWPLCPTDPAARERRRRQVVAGAYPLRQHETAGRDPRGDGRADPRGAGRRRAPRRPRLRRRRRVRDQPGPAVPCPAGPAWPGEATRAGSSTRSSPPNGPRRWSPSSTVTRIPWPSWA